MSLSTFIDHKTHIETLDKSNFLGRICLYTVNATRVKHTVAKEMLDKAGLGGCVPAKPADIDVFRRIFQNGARRKFATAVPDVSENLLIRPVSSTKERIVKRVVSEIVDASGETLSYTEAFDVRFSVSHPERIEIAELSPNAHAQTLIDALVMEYLNERGCLNSDGIRNIVRRALAECRATSVREGGGVFFIMEEYADKLNAIEELSRHIPGCTVHSFPLLDDRKQRDLIRESFRTEAGEDLDKLILEMDEVLAGGEVGSGKFERFSDRYTALKAKAEKYGEILEDELILSGLRVEMVQSRLGRVLRKSLDI